jgi:hypothetical protein
MFMQVIQGHVSDVEALRRRGEMWRTELMPGATGFLGSTMGVTPDGTGVVVARFESEAAAKANGARPEQDAWWHETEAVFDGAVEFIDCPDCDMIMGGGSDDAHFVQLIECKVKDREQMRTAGREMEDSLRTMRPDIMGGIVGWRGDHEMVQVMYFTDEEHARQGEQTMGGDGDADRWMQMLDGEPRYLDLKDPEFS